MNKNILLFFVCSLTLVTFNFVTAQDVVSLKDTAYKKVVVPNNFSTSIDEVYTTVGDWNGRVDIYFQSNETTPTAIIINIHGGGWKNGVKEAQGGFTQFFKAGYSIANVEYRMTNQATAPAAVEDLRCALIYLIKNAKKFNIDTKKIVVMGGSAGGHLALMTGLLGNNHLFDSNCPIKDKINVAAIIDKYGITDVWDWAYTDYGPAVKKSKSPGDWLGPKKNDEAFAKTVSPIWYVNKNSPPTLIIHGTADSTVPIQQSAGLYKKLSELGVKTDFIKVEGGGHGRFSKEKNAELNNQIIQFISETPAFKKQ